MDETSKKTLFEQKLADPNTALESLMANDLFLESFRSGNPQLLSFLKTQHYRKLITFVTVVGPEQDKLRSYQYPQLACDVFLTAESPIVTDVLFSRNSEAKNSELIYEILDYFKTTPNYTLSGYVIKIIGNLYFNHPFKIQEFMIKGGYGPLMLKFLESKSVAEFLIRLIVIEDENLLNSHFEERRQLLHEVMKQYTDKNVGDEEKIQLCFILIDVLARLWTSKHKESGRFAPQIFKIVEIALNEEYENYPDHETLVSVVMKNICNHVDVAPFLIKKLTKKIIKQLSTFEVSLQPASHNKQVPRFTQRNLKFLIGLTHIMSHLNVIQDLFKSCNVFGLLWRLMEQFEWNNIIHVEVQKIFKQAFESQSQVTYNNIFKKGDFVGRVTEMIDNEKTVTKFGKGYSGCLTNILIALNEGMDKETVIGKLVRKNNPAFEKLIHDYIQPKMNSFKVDLAGYKLNNEFAKAKYEQNSLFDKYENFFQCPPSPELLAASISSVQSSEALQEMENESTLNQHLVQQQGQKQVKEQISV